MSENQDNIFIDSHDFYDSCMSINPKGKIIAIDYGSKKLGLASTDLEILIAVPKLIYQRTKFDSDKKFLHDLIINEKVVGLVFGLPLNADGTANEASHKIADFVASLELQIPVLFVNEIMTTKHANELLKETGMNRKKRNEIDDKIAAQLILKSFIESL